MNPGFVYILTNQSMPGLIKIGRTTRAVDLRAAELWQTGVPTRFDVYASEKTYDCVQLEAYVHGDLRKSRVSKSREFFAIDAEKAREKVRFWAEFQASELISENFGCVVSVPFRTWVDGWAVEELAVKSGHSESIIAAAMADLTLRELAPAIARIITKREDEDRQFLANLGLIDGAEMP